MAILIPDLTALATLASGDLLIVNDVSEVSAEPVKKLTMSTLLAWIDANKSSPVPARCAFDGTASDPISVEANGVNVGSVTKNGTGDYTINFTTALPHTNYAVMGMCVQSATDANLVVGYQSASARAVGSVRVVVEDRSGILRDSALITITVIG